MTAPPTTSDPAGLIRNFCAAFARADVDELLGFLDEDAVYHNMPLEPAVGHDAIRATLQMFLPDATDVEFEVVDLLVVGDRVATERIDRMTIGDRRIELPVAGFFEVEGDRIRAWRDYFDLQSFFGA